MSNVSAAESAVNYNFLDADDFKTTGEDSIGTCEWILKILEHGDTMAAVTPAYDPAVVQLVRDNPDDESVIVPIAIFSQRTKADEVERWFTMWPRSIVRVLKTQKPDAPADVMPLREPPNLSVALILASAGIAIFPCNESKKPLVKWRDNSTTRTELIRYWFRTWPNSLVGIDLAKTGLIVVDADRHDPAKDGVAALQTLEMENEPFDAHPIIRTPRNGYHHVFGQPDGEPLGNSMGALPDGIDIRGDGGYVIASGCVTDTGAWVADDESPDLVESFKAGVVPVLPAWFVEILRARRERPEPEPRRAAEPPPRAPETAPVALSSLPGARERAVAETALDGNCAELAACSEGERNTKLNSLAYRMGRMVARHWISQAIVETRLYEAADACGLLKSDGRRQVLATIASGLKGGMAKPHPDLTEDDTIRVEILDDGTRINAETGEVFGTPGVQKAEVETDYHAALERLSRTDGLIGAMTEFTVETARKPNRILALGAAIAVAGTLIGRRVATPTRSGTHTYMLALDRTAGGKQHIIDSSHHYLDCAGAAQCIGPDEFMTGSAVVDFMDETPLGLCCQDEFGDFLLRINSGKASGWERQCMKWLKTLYGISFGVWTGPRWAGRKFERLYAPAMSIFGLSTPEKFWSSLSSAHLEDGFVNRFILIEAPDLFVRARTPGMNLCDISDDMKSDLAALHRGALPENPQKLSEMVFDVYNRNCQIIPDVRPWGIGAQRRWEEFRDDVDLRIYRDRDLDRYLGRVAENTIRLATIHAACRQPRNPSFVVAVSDVDWAIQFMMVTSGRMVASGRANIGKEDTRDNRILSALREFIGQHPMGVQRSVITKKLSSSYGCKSKQVDEFIETLCASHEIGKRGGVKRGDPVIYYPL